MRKRGYRDRGFRGGSRRGGGGGGYRRGKGFGGHAKRQKISARGFGDEMQVSESEVGITHTIGADKKGSDSGFSFCGTLKQRFSDFQVEEIYQGKPMMLTGLLQVPESKSAKATATAAEAAGCALGEL